MMVSNVEIIAYIVDAVDQRSVPVFSHCSIKQIIRLNLLVLHLLLLLAVHLAVIAIFQRLNLY